MPFTEENKPLLDAAAAIDFKLKKNGAINYHKHNAYERGLFFIKQAIEKHGNKYGYTKVRYIDTNTKVTITCEHHGDFLQTPNNHLKWKGCAKCAGNHTPSTEEFIEKARNVHGDKYDYSSAQYNINSEKIEICCPILGHGSFFTAPSNHLRGSGCPKCANSLKASTTEDFIAKAREIHGDKYDYTSVRYQNNKEKIEILCPLHGSFFQAPTDHLGFHGCPRCGGQNHNILYLLKCLETGWYKIGITTNNTKKRMSDLGGNLEEIYHVKLEDPKRHESILHKRYAKDREYNLCVRDGKTEFFSLTKDQVQEVIEYMNEVSSNA